MWTVVDMWLPHDVVTVVLPAGGLGNFAHSQRRVCVGGARSSVPQGRHTACAPNRTGVWILPRCTAEQFFSWFTQVAIAAVCYLLCVCVCVCVCACGCGCGCSGCVLWEWARLICYLGVTARPVRRSSAQRRK